MTKDDLKPPDPCPICNEKPVLRKTCPNCGQGEWVIEHVGHERVSGPREVIPCLCSSGTWQGYEAKDRRKKNAKAGRAVGEHRLPTTTPEMAKKAASLMARGVRPYRAMLEAGFSKAQASQGKTHFNKMVRVELKAIGARYIKDGADLTPEDQENLVRGMLYNNVVLRSDKGVMSAKQLGADKRIAMWQPDSQVGMVVIRAPEVPKLAHPITLVVPKFKDEDGI